MTMCFFACVSLCVCGRVSCVVVRVCTCASLQGYVVGAFVRSAMLLSNLLGRMGRGEGGICIYAHVGLLVLGIFC